MTFITGEWGQQAKKRYIYRRDSGYWKKRYQQRKVDGYSNYKYELANLAKLKYQVFEKYNFVCKKCGFSDIRALQIDHVNNDGYSERRNKISLRTFLNKVLKDTSGRYQLLCANCNFIKRIENKKGRGVTN